MSEDRLQEEAGHHAEEADALIDLGRFQEALAACSRAIASDPENAFHYYTLARIHLGLENHQEALAAARQVISLEPEWPFGYFIISICLHNVLDFDGELQAAEHAVSLAPEEPDLLDRLARAQMRSGLLRKAKITATQLTKVSPEDADTHSLLSDICFQLDDYKTAEPHVREALRQQPENHILHNDLGRIHLVTKQWRDAIDAFYNAVKLQPGEQIYRDNLNMAVTCWADSNIWKGKRGEALASLPPEILSFYQHKRESRTAFQKLGMFGPMLIVLVVLILLVQFFNSIN